MLELLGLGVAVVSAGLGYVKARNFVRGRLRYVDTVQRPVIPFAAGFAAALVTAPLVWLLPLIGGGTAIAFGIAVGAGVAQGARDIRRAAYRIEG